MGASPGNGEPMKLYIANCSKQNHNFTYSLPENMRPFLREVLAGHQIEIDSTEETLNTIIGQHVVYGLQKVKEVKKGFGGLCYQFDKPINVEAIHNGFSQTEQEQIDRALKARMVTAVAADNLMASKAQEYGVRQTGIMEVEILEDQKGFSDSAPKFQETIEIQRDGLKNSRGRNKKGN